jgi:hypothetical protein
MRWFLSYWITVLICWVFAGIYFVAGENIEGVSKRVREFFNGEPPGLLIPVLVAAVYLFVRFVLHRVLAYTESAIEASPRGDGVRGRRRAAFGNAAYTAFGNPTGLWLSPFALILGAAAALAVFLSRGLGMSHDPGLSLLLTLMGLYAVVTASAMANPDHPQPLRYVETDSELDPTMVHPSETTAQPTKSRNPFRRKKAAAPPTP